MMLKIDCVACLFKHVGLGRGGSVELRGKNYSYFPTGSCCIIVFTQCNVMESDVTLRFLHLKAKGMFLKLVQPTDYSFKVQWRIQDFPNGRGYQAIFRGANQLYGKIFATNTA